MSSAVAGINKRKSLSYPLEGDATNGVGGKRAAQADSSDDEDDKLRRERMRDVMQTVNQQPTPSAAATADTSSAAPCTHTCPRCCARVLQSARRVTFPFLDGEWLLRPVGGRVAHVATPRTAAYKHGPAELPTSYNASIAAVARSRLHAQLSRQLDLEQHAWTDSADEQRAESEEDAMDWTQLVAGTARPRAAEEAGSAEQAATDAVDADGLTSRERRKLKRKQERSQIAALQPAGTIET